MGSQCAGAFTLVRLPQLMERTSGSAGIHIGLIDGPINLDHPNFEGSRINAISGRSECRHPQSFACAHGTFVAGILNARRGSFAPAIAPGCTLLLRPIFNEGRTEGGGPPSTSPQELAGAIFDTVRAQ